MSARIPDVLDPTSGTRAMWRDKADQRAIFGDLRAESVTVADGSHGRPGGVRTLTVAPDVRMDFRALPFRDETFRLVVYIGRRVRLDEHYDAKLKTVFHEGGEVALNFTHAEGFTYGCSRTIDTPCEVLP